ncbi:hypothetical protein [Streptomyces sp. NPDC058249]|uniref:hypothetical protein n=1 Tax=Streptomyces sp. NPDC058249 TaxID=3346403 RepID=UPI0036E52E15
MSELIGTEPPFVREDDIPAAFRAIVAEGWIVDECGAQLLKSLRSGYSGATCDEAGDVVHFEATVNGRGMMDYDLPQSGPDRQNQLMRRSLAYACAALQAAPANHEWPVLGYVSLSEGGLDDDLQTAHVTFCSSRPSVPRYVEDLDAYTQEALLEVSREDAAALLSGSEN